MTEEKGDLSGYVFALVVLLALFGVGVAQGQISMDRRYFSPGAYGSAAFGFSPTIGMHLNGTASYWNAGNGTFGVYAFGANPLKVSGTQVYPGDSDDTVLLGIAGQTWQSTYVSRSIQGSKSKVLADNIAAAFVRISVADDDYEGGYVNFTAYAEDTATDARQVTAGRVAVAILNNSGTEACTFGTADVVSTVTAGTLTCAFTCASNAADTIDLSAACNTSLAATTTLTFEYRLDLQSTATVTPQ